MLEAQLYQVVQETTVEAGTGLVTVQGQLVMVNVVAYTRQSQPQIAVN